MLKRLASLLLVSLVAGCGGGGGSAGTSQFGTGSGTGSSGGTTTGTAAYVMALDVQRAGASTAQISSTETVQAVATVSSASGSPVSGVVVTFAQTGSPSVTFAPVAATALTDASGKASVDFGAANPTATGATTINASGTVATTSVTATKAISIAAGSVTSVAVPAAVNFVSSVPSGTAIVVKGAGGNGRTESAVLTFAVVDASGAPVSGASVNFALNTTNGGATLQSTTGTSNSSGQVTVTVSSGTAPATIVVTASTTLATGTVISSQSDTLIVSNSVPVSGGFEIVAAKYNLDGRTTGDSTTVTAYVRDQFGNPVPDGVAVSFTTDFGAVASSTLGGCTTVNGTCTVTFRVQNPRPTTNGIATVTGMVGVGTSTQLVESIQINMAGAASSAYLAYDLADAGPATQVTLTSCKQSFQLLLTDGTNHSTAAGTLITPGFASNNVAVTVTSGSPVLDQLSGFSPTLFGFQVDLATSAPAPPCVAGGTVKSSGLYFELQYQTPHGITFLQRFDLNYPQ